MKKAIVCILLSLIMCFGAVFYVSAADEQTITLGISTEKLYAGSTFTLSIIVDGSNIASFNTTITYNDSLLTYISSSSSYDLVNKWTVSPGAANGKIKIIGEDSTTDASRPISSKTTVAKLAFQISSTASVGNLFKFTAEENVINQTGSSGITVYNPGTFTLERKVVRTPSSDAQLKAMTVTDGSGKAVELNKLFTPGTTDYSCSVPYETSRLTVNATANDANASVSLNSPTLAANGYTNVTVTVTAENGSTKRVYTIKVYRAQDPNYQSSGNAELSSLSVSGFPNSLSPKFSSTVYEYTLYVPYETASISVSATQSDGKGKGYTVSGNDSLSVGKNRVTVTSTAEDNSTRKDYVIIVIRLDASGSQGEETGGETTTAPDGTSHTDAATGITVYAPAGALNDGAELSVSTVTSGAEYNAAAASTDGSVLAMYELSAVEGGSSVTPGGMLLFSLPAPEGSDELGVALVGYDGSVKLLSSAVSGGVITFSSDKFGYFAVISGTPVTSDTETGGGQSDDTHSSSESVTGGEKTGENTGASGGTVQVEVGTWKGMFTTNLLKTLIIIVVCLLVAFFVGFIVRGKVKKVEKVKPQPTAEDYHSKKPAFVFDETETEKEAPKDNPAVKPASKPASSGGKSGGKKKKKK